MSGGELELVVDDWRAAWEGRSEDGFAASCTADVSYEDPVLTDPLEGLDALARQAERVRQAFPDMRLERTAPELRSADHVCIPWRMLGTHTGEVSGLPATERFLILHGVHYAELRDGRIRRARGFFDLYDAAVQLGLLPARGGLGEMALLMIRGFGLRTTRP